MSVTASTAWAPEAVSGARGSFGWNYHSQREDTQQQSTPHLHHQQQQEGRVHYVWPVLPASGGGQATRGHAGPSLMHVSTQTESSQPSAMEVCDAGPPQWQQESSLCTAAPSGILFRSGVCGGLLPQITTAGLAEDREMMRLRPSVLGTRQHDSISSDLEENEIMESPNTGESPDYQGHRCRSAILKRIVSSSDPNQYALLGPVTCNELYTLASLLRQDLVRVRWLYLAVQGPYRKGEFSHRATHAIADLADALATNKRLQGVILRMPQSELGSKQLGRIVGAFTQTLRSNQILTSLQFKPPGFFRQRGADFDSLVEAGRLPEQCRVAFLSGSHSRLGKESAVSTLPKEVLQRIVDYCTCSVV